MYGRSGPTFEEPFKELRDVLGPLVRSVTNFEGHVQTISRVVLVTTRITNVEQIANALSSKMAVFETGGGATGTVSASSVRIGRILASTWTATGYRDPSASTKIQI